MQIADCTRVSTVTAIRCALDALRWADPQTNEDLEAEAVIKRELVRWRIRLENNRPDEALE
jgi:hypothetical protein